MHPVQMDLIAGWLVDEVRVNFNLKFTIDFKNFTVNKVTALSRAVGMHKML